MTRPSDYKHNDRYAAWAKTIHYRTPQYRTFCGISCTQDNSARSSHPERPVTCSDCLDTVQPSDRGATVKRVDLFGNVTDTFQTEAELNGHKATQGRLI